MTAAFLEIQEAAAEQESRAKRAFLSFMAFGVTGSKEPMSLVLRHLHAMSI